MLTKDDISSSKSSSITDSSGSDSIKKPKKLTKKTSKRGTTIGKDTEALDIIELIVDPENGPYKTIQSAIDVAKPNYRIKVFSGLYKENLIITRGPLQIDAKELSSEVYVMGNKGPTIYVELEDPSAEVRISYIRLTHKGGMANRFYKQLKSEDKFEVEKLDYATIDDQAQLFQCFDFESITSDSLFFLKTGKAN